MPECLVLILGGTEEARLLATALAEDGRCRPLLSLVGRTCPPPAVFPVRFGGFGGAQGLAGYLDAAKAAYLVDAAHPFAARIKANAVDAAAASGVALLRLERAAWQAEMGDRWYRVPDLAAALRLLPALGSRVFAPLGAAGSARLPELAGVTWIVRSFVLPDHPPPGTVRLEASRTPTLEEEIATLRDHRVDALLVRDSGSRAGYPKLLAARRLGLPVVMLDRPALPPAPTVATVADALAWIYDRLGRSTCV